MKTDFRNISDVNVGQIYFLYGNYRNTFGVFCDFISRKLKDKIPQLRVKFCSINDVDQLQNSQADLFGGEYFCYCIRGVDDKCIDKVLSFPRDRNTFILESGDYLKSKKITAEFTKNSEVLACASFDNDLTFNSLSRMLLPGKSSAEYSEIVRVMKTTDESLLSLFAKLELLENSQLTDYLRQYSCYKRSFVSDLEFISFVRYALQAAVKENVFHQNQSYTKLNLKNKIHILMNAEIKHKLNSQIEKSFLYQNLI
ncbi:MAG: hypothetical protein IJA14_03580 [Alphaproteobacteria bacterium]|nr:hypothetical protein [Alphaproteobacteria bacterium]